MGQKIAVLILHGAGTPKENFADKLIARITKEFNKKLPKRKADVEIVF